MRRRSARNNARAAVVDVRGSPRLLASTLPVPPGTSPSVMFVPTSPAAICMAVPSPPWLTNTSNPSVRDCSAMRRASPGPATDRTWTFHPPASRMSRIAAALFSCARAAKGLVISSALVISVAPLPEEIEADLPQLGLVVHVELAGGARAQRLEACFGAPLRAQPVLHRRAERVGPAHLPLDLGTIAGVHDHKCLGADRPSRRDLGAREGIRDIPGANLEIVERHPKVRDHGALQLTGEE